MYFGKLGARFGRAPLINPAIPFVVAMLGTSDGLFLDARENLLKINHAATPANTYQGDPGRKLSIGGSGARQWLDDGTLGWRPENSVLQSQTFESPSWSKARLSVSSDIDTAPDGTLTADKLVEDSTPSNNHFVSQGVLAVTSGNPIFISAYFKASGRSIVQLKLAVGFAVDPVVEFDLSSETFVTRQGTISGRFITPVGGGWYRCGFSSIPNSSTNTILQVFLCNSAASASYNGDGVSGVLIWGAQLERSLVVGEYRATTSAAYYGMRRDFDPRLANVSGRCGYLIEEARTNLALRSENLTTTWATEIAGNGVAPTVTAAYSSEIGLSFSRLQVSRGSVSTANRSRIKQTVATTSATWSLSFWAKLTSGSTPVTIDASFPGVTQQLVVTSTLQRFVITGSSSGGGDLLIGVYSASSDLSADILIAGVQCELGSFASSYIPTTSASITRAADLVTLAGTLFPLNSSEGTLYSKFMTMGGANAQYLVTLDNANNTEAVQPLRLNTGPMRAVITDGNVHQLGTVGLESTASVSVLSVSKSAVGYKLNDSAVAQAGETVQTDIVCTMPTLTQIVFGNRGLDGLRALNGWLFEAAYFPTRKTNSQLQALASGYASDALLLMESEPQGLTFSATDQTMEIKDTTTPANNYSGELSAKLGSIATSGRRRYLSSGLLGWGPENRFLRSQEFDLSWSRVNCSVVANDAVAPDGTLTADRITYSAQFAHASQTMTIVVGETYTFSVWLKSVSGPGTVTLMVDYGGGTLQASNITITNEWVRYTHTFTAVTAVSLNPAVGIQERSGSSFDVIHAWGAQFERASSASTYKPTTSAAYYGLRLDYDNRLTGGPGYLVEEARTNIALRSQEFDNAAWITSTASVTANGIAAPDGTTTADLVFPTSTGTDRAIRQDYTKAASSLTYAFSIYAKASTWQWILVELQNGANIAGKWFDLTNIALGTTRTLGAGFSLVSSSIQDVGNGWRRLNIVVTTDANTNLSSTLVLADADNSNTATTSGSNGVYLWGAQLELASFATSYIPTTTASVTRAIDVPLISQTLFPSAQALWSMYVRFTLMDVSAVRYPLTLGTSVNERIELRMNGNAYQQICISNGGTSTAGSAGTLAAFTKAKMSGRFATNDFRYAYTGGNLGALDNAGAMPTLAMTNMGFGCQLGGSAMNGWLHEVAGAPANWNDATLQAKAA